MTVSIIVPVYNEVRTVRAVIDRLLTIDLPVAREILIVDDGSTDGTREVLAQAEAEGVRVTILFAERNGGKGSAIRRGLARATGTIVAIQDADLELDPQQIAALLGPIVRGESMVVYGSRFLAGASPAPWVSVLANRVLTGVTNVLFGSSLTDMETCYKIMRTDVARSLRSDRRTASISSRRSPRGCCGRGIASRTAGAVRCPVTRAGQEDWLARRRPGGAGAAR